MKFIAILFALVFSGCCSKNVSAATVAVYDFAKDVGSINSNYKDGGEAYVDALMSCREKGGTNCETVYMGTQSGYIAIARCDDVVYWAQGDTSPEDVVNDLKISIVSKRGTMEKCVLMSVVEDRKGLKLNRPDLKSKPKKSSKRDTEV